MNGYLPRLCKILVICLGASLINWLDTNQALGKSCMAINQKAWQLYQEANKYYETNAYPQAIELLQQALSKDKSFITAYLQLAVIYQQLDDASNSQKYLDQAYNYLPTTQCETLYYDIAYAYYRLGLYSKAHTVLQAMPPTDKDKLQDSLLAKITHLKSHLEFALEKIQHPIAFNPRKLPLPLNQFIAQYFPVLTIDQASLLFTACTDHDNPYHENLYISHKDAQGHWSTPVSIADQINSPISNEGTCTIAADKKTLVFTSCARKGNYGMCDLYISYQQGGVWSVPQNLGPHINGPGWQSQPALSADGKTLYFVAERPGNYGKKDIWTSNLTDNGQWSKAIHLEAPINSPFQEIAPFIHPNGKTLFFASDRVPSMGGFDIYYANYIEGKWSEPVNLGYPINNHQDQVSLFITADGRKAYYAGGKHQGSHYYNSYLYEFDIPQGLLAIPASEVIRIRVLDEQTKQPLPAHITVHEWPVDNVQQSLVVDQADGETMVVIHEGKEYSIYIQQAGYVFESIQVNYKEGKKELISPQQEVLLKPIAIGQTKILQNVYFKFDEYTLEERSIIELNCLVAFLQGNPTLTIKLAGHTDHLGTANYNNNLSTKRSKAIYDYLVTAGIPTNKLTYQGYGASQPCLPNDSPRHRQLNRRVAFEIMHMHTK